MKSLQLLYKSVIGMLMGINLGAILGGVIGAAAVGPEWLIGGMLLGAAAGSLFGSAAGFLQNVNLDVPSAERRPSLSPVRSAHPLRAQYARVRVSERG